MKTLSPDETILGLLAAEARHGYQLLQCFQDSSGLGEVWSLSTSQLYAVLKRLEQRGLIAGQQITSETAPTRTEYCLTPGGAKALEAWLDDPTPSASINHVRVQFLSRLFIARLLNLDTVPLVRRQRLACEQRKAQLLARRQAAAPGIGLLTIELVLAQLNAAIDWIDRCELVPRTSE